MRIVLHLLHQKGATLVVSLLLLVILTLLGVAATTNSRIESQISMTDRRHKEAFAAAEYALVFGEKMIDQLENTQALPPCPAAHEGSICLVARDEHTPLTKFLGTRQWNAKDSTAIQLDDIPEGLGYIRTLVVAAKAAGAKPEKVEAPLPHYILIDDHFRRHGGTIGYIRKRAGTQYVGVAARGVSARAASTILYSTYAQPFN